MSGDYILAFNRGNGIERWFEPFASIGGAIAEADSLLEYGNASWFQVEQDGNVVMDNTAVMRAIAELMSKDEDD